MKEYTMKEISDILINYINKNKNKNDIDYLDTIKSIESLLEEIKNDYETLEYYKQQEELTI